MKIYLFFKIITGFVISRRMAKLVAIGAAEGAIFREDAETGGTARRPRRFKIIDRIEIAENLLFCAQLA